MTAPNSYSCLIVGDGALTIQCGRMLLERGHRIVGVATDEAAVRDWAARAGLAVFAAADLAAGMSAEPVDYLFSIVNLRMVPASVLGLARRGGINFHDGPLPRYAGINATSWALIAGEPEYGVTWHEMAAGADEGRVLAQRTFELADGETAFSLNARCFDAGMESFAELADALTDGTLTPRTQDLAARTYFARLKRPDAASVIDFAQSADRVAAFVAAHDYGVGYPNPFGVAKVVSGGRAIVVGRAEALSTRSGAAPGTIVAADDGLVVAASDADVRLEALRCPDGLPVDAAKLSEWGFVEGLTLSVDRARVGELAASAVRREVTLVAHLSALEPASIAGVAPSERTEPLVRRLHLGSPSSPAGAAARALAFVSRLNDERPVDVALRLGALDAARDGHEALFASRVPFRLEVDPAAPAPEALASLEAAIASVAEAGPFLRDVFSRDPRLAGVARDADGVVLPVELRVGRGTLAPTRGAQLTIDVDDGGGLTLHLVGVGDDAAADALVRQMETWSRALDAEGAPHEGPIGEVPIVTDEERRRVLDEFAGATTTWPQDATVHGLIAEQAARTPDAPALTFKGETIRYAELEAWSNQVARQLRGFGVRAGVLVGIGMERSIEMVVAALAVHKAGGAYVPLDPDYPAERLEFMIDDARVAVVVTQERVRFGLPVGEVPVLSIDGDSAAIERQSTEPLDARSGPSDLAYVIYTSGSTGRPKGVMVEHRNVVSFFAGMDERVGREPGAQPVWLAVTSMNFDISVLELFWTLARGFHVVVHAEDNGAADFVPQHGERPIEFGVFYFSSDESEGLVDKYQLLLEGARFADRNGFTSVWTPERHFHAFGGLFPNPAVTSAALATITENVSLRAGSCVTPLHSPIRIAEEWSVVDNLSRGRVGLSVASGWQPNDFVIRPEAFAARHEQIFEDIETLRALWRGETRPFVNGEGNTVDIRILPRPYSDTLPIWVTAAGNPATFERAGRVGANLLTHLLGQSVDELRDKIAVYRRAWDEAGHPGRGVVSLMLHTYVGTTDAEARERVREPMKAYLRSAVGLVKSAAWSFPTFKKTTTMQDGSFGIDHLSDEDMDALLDFAFERYYETAGLFGDIAKCVRIVDAIKGADVDEIPCLIDFGVSTPDVIEALPRLAEVLRRANELVGVDRDAADFSFAAQVARHGVTHFQCTPSQMRLLLADDANRDALAGLRTVLVGGEPLPAPMARELAALVSGEVVNMYGPTETTIWSTTAPVRAGDEIVSIGTPIPNTRVVMLDRRGRLLPPGWPGELCIGGPGVVRGYLGRPELTDERFVPSPFDPPGARLYRTGDLASFADDGTIRFHGRADHQVKVRGHRIELGEVEARIAEHPAVRAAVAIVREDSPGDVRIVGYCIPSTADGIDRTELRVWLAERLPEHMVPSNLVVLERFPETPNRKVDRRALPAPEADAASPSAAYVAPESDTEERIAVIWREVLGVARVGTRDNFFDIGGHSLLTIQVHAMLREQVERPLSLVDLFRYPTIEALAQYLDAGDQVEELLEQTRERAAGRKAAMARRRAVRDRRT